MGKVQDEEILNKINLLRQQLESRMQPKLRAEKLNLLRHYLGQIEKEEEKVKYDYINDNLIYSESIKIAIVLIKHLETLIINEKKLEEKIKLDEIMKQQYYYLARYLYSYFAIAIEFGIPKEKQFLAPRTCVLNYINWELTKFYYRDRAVMTISMPQGTGKEQPLSSKILTPKGWTTMGEIKIGDKVISAKGRECKVTGVYPKGLKDVYQVKFDDGSIVECGLEHLWEVKTVDDRRRNKPARVLQLKDMLDNYILGKKSKRPYHNYSVRLVKPIEFESKLTKEDIKPYVLGALIGDGGLSNNCVKFTTNDSEILERIEKELFKTDKIREYNCGKYDYGISKKEDLRNEKGYYIPSKTQQKIRDYGLDGKASNEKFIPKKYLYASVKERIDLLRGLMDTDGWTDKRDCNCEFDTVSKQLCSDFIELVRGLGGKANFSTKIGKYKDKNGNIKECKKVYRIYFSININPFYLKRKADQFTEPQFNYQKMIVEIKKVRQEKCQCIMVDDDEHLYVTDGYTLTHNTEDGKRFMAWAIGKNPNLPKMMVSYSANIAKDKFYNGIMALTDDENGNFQKIFPKLKLIYKNAETMSLDYRDDDKKSIHSEYTLYCAGFDGSITGRTRAHDILYVDDLVKNIEEASNKDVMDKKWDEFTGTLKKRMQGNCKLLLIGTIFSINDPLSRIIEYYKRNNPDRIKIIKVPGLNENNESNFNYKYGFAITTEMFLEDKDLMDTVSFECLIQQHPIERLGILFNENEMNKYEEYDDKQNFIRNVAAVDVAWGGGDYLSMPICSEYKNGDCPLIDVYFSQDKKEETIPAVVDKIIEHHITRCHFEANNGGDMYAEKVKEELKNRGITWCNITWGRVPTTKSKLDRILASVGAITGADKSEYRLLIKKRTQIKNNFMYNEFLDQVFKFNQSIKMQGKQHDDACFSKDTLIATPFGNKKIIQLKKGDKVITPFGIDTIKEVGNTGIKETINKFGLRVTKNHKIFDGKEFAPADRLTSIPQNGKMLLKELIKWKYLKLLYSMELNIRLWGREDIILANQTLMKEGNMRKAYMSQFGSFIMEKKFLKAIIFIIKMGIPLITTFLTWNVYQLSNSYQKMEKKIGQKQNIEKKQLNNYKKQERKLKNGIRAKKEEHGIKNMLKRVLTRHKNTNIFVSNVEKNILVQELQKQNIVAKDVDGYTVENKKEKVYNIKTQKYGCYYANGILVSNCDSLANLFQNVLECSNTVGEVHSHYSRENLGI